MSSDYSYLASIEMKVCNDLNLTNRRVKNIEECGSLNINGPIGSYIWMLGHLRERFDRD